MVVLWSGEWPVYFHCLKQAKGTIRSYHKAGNWQVSGRGIDSEPHLHDAKVYSKIFTSNIAYKTYKGMLQVNPAKRHPHRNY